MRELASTTHCAARALRDPSLVRIARLGDGGDDGGGEVEDSNPGSVAIARRRWLEGSRVRWTRNWSLLAIDERG